MFKKVDCATKCHIKEPSTNQEFSHVNMIQKFDNQCPRARNGRKAQTFSRRFAHLQILPHQSHVQPAGDGLWGNSEALSNETLARCIGCHTKENWAQNFYAHFTHRMRRRRTHAEVVKLCTSCHEDAHKMARHGLESIETFKDTFHWNLVRYGVKNAPDCISCHIPVGYSTHDIRPRTDPVSPLYILNRIQTCSNQGGIQTCHPGATAEFATGRVHAYGTKVQMMAGRNGGDLDSQEMATVLKRAEAETSEAEVFHYQVLQLIKLVYKILIGGTVLFMGFHQWLDFLAAKRKHKKSTESS